mgnify:FL=1
MIRIGILASHAGTTAQAVIDACHEGTIAATVAVIISNNADSQALDRARTHGIPAVHLSRTVHPDPDDLDQAITGTLTANDVDLVLLAGYMRKVGPSTLRRYHGKVVNVHPALLPRHGGRGMYGAAVHAAVLASGDQVTGATVHIVTEEYDTGPALAQRQVAVDPGDDVAAIEAKVRVVERQLLIETLARLALSPDPTGPARG